MEDKEVKEIIQDMPEEAVRENLMYLVRNMEDEEQKEFLGLE